MLKNEKQYNSAKTKLTSWLKTQEQLRGGASAGQPDWVVAEQAFGVEQQIKQLSADIKQYEDTVAGKIKLPSPSVISEIPQWLIAWRIARHWTQRDLADRVGMHENQIQKYESDDYGCASYQTISKIAAALEAGEKESRNRAATGRGSKVE